MPNKTPTQSIQFNNIESHIIELRNQKVLLDSSVATIYGVETRDINQAVKNNPQKFPEGYVFETTRSELEDLRWNISTAKLSKTRALPKAFTEKGLYMLATILKSSQATRATLQIIETFAKVREFSKVAKTLAVEADPSEQKKLITKSGELIADILNQEFAHDTQSETTIELNLAMIKVKHTIKKEHKK